jgi:MOSC domain-containing protein YiiM
MDPVGRATLVAGKGIERNADQGGKRQVTIIDGGVFETLRRDLGPAVDPVMRRANLMVRGVSLIESRGRVLRVGAARIRVHGETRPCHLMDEALPGLRAALKTDWRGGVFGEIVEGGEIELGDPVDWDGER